MRCPVPSNYILGVDPSLRHTGVIVFNTDNFNVVYQGVIGTSAAVENHSVDAYRQIIGGIECLCSEYPLSDVFVEQMFQSKNSAITEMLFLASFCVRYAASNKEVPYTVVPVMGKPSGTVSGGWKHFVLGAEYTKLKGAAGKRGTRRTLESALDTSFKNEHIADAAGIALAGWYLKTGVDFRTVLGKPVPPGRDETDIAAAKAVVKATRRINAKLANQPDSEQD